MIRPSFESLNTLTGQSFLVRHFREKSFSAPFHYHPELELTLIVKGEGKRYVGNNMSPYTAGDLVLLGPDLPHCWKSENTVPGKINASSIVLQFREDCLGEGFFVRNEMQVINKLFKKSKSGIQFAGNTAAEVAKHLYCLEKENQPFRRTIVFLEILQLLGDSSEFTLLNKEKKIHEISIGDQSRINDVMAYIVDHFRNEITLEGAAAVAGLTPTAFCKYFKRITRKTFINVVTEYRINYAQQQLVNTDQPVSSIGFESGFRDPSHFYKTFRQKNKLSPMHYRKKFRRDITV